MNVKRISRAATNAREEPEPHGEPMGPPPDAYLERFAWNITRNIRHGLRQAEKPAWERRKARARQGHVNTVDCHLCRLDPLYHRTVQALEADLRQMPPRARKILVRKFLKDPRLYLEIYREQRQVAALVEAMLREQRATGRGKQAAPFGPRA